MSVLSPAALSPVLSHFRFSYSPLPPCLSQHFSFAVLNGLFISPLSLSHFILSFYFASNSPLISFYSSRLSSALPILLRPSSILLSFPPSNSPRISPLPFFLPCPPIAHFYHPVLLFPHYNPPFLPSLPSFLQPSLFLAPSPFSRYHNATKSERRHRF